MTFGFRGLSTFGVIWAAGLALAACGGGSSSTKSSSTGAATRTTTSAPVTVVGRSMSVVVNPAITAALKHANITVTALPPASSKTHNTVLIFPATGGQIVSATVTGTVYDTGGLTLSHAGKSVRLTSLIVNTSTKQVIAEVGKRQVAAFDLELASLKRASGRKGSFVASDIKLTTTTQLATSLNSGLAVNTFRGGQNFGIVTLTIAVKP